MNLPLAGSLNQSARHYVEKIGALYDRARSLVTHRPHNDSRLQLWEWHRASAEACIDEASTIYADGLRALVKEDVGVSYSRKGLGAAQFHCRVGCAADPAPSFRVHRGVKMDTPEEREAVERLFGGIDPEVLEAFAEGLCRMQRLGAFQREHSIMLQPEPEILPEPVLPADGNGTNT